MKAQSQRANRAAQQLIQPVTSQRKAGLARLYNPHPHLPSTLFRSPPSPISTPAPPVAAAAAPDLAASTTGARRATARQAEMAPGNKFQILYGLDDDNKFDDDNVFDDESEFDDDNEGDDFDEDDMAAIGVLADGLQVPDVGIPAGALPAPAVPHLVQIAAALPPAAVLPLVQIAAALPPAAVLPIVQVAPALPPAAVLHGVQIALALPPAVLAVDNTENPWTEVPARRVPRNPNAPLQVEDIPVPEARVCVEVPWVPKTGSLRRIKKHAQARKSGYVPTADGDSGTYIYGSFGTNGIEY